MAEVVVIETPSQTVNVTFQAPQNVSVVAPTTVSTTSTSQEIVNLQEVLGIVGPQGPEGPQGQADQYSLVAVSSWTQTHTFDHKPAVTILDNGTASVSMEVTYPTTNSVHLEFPTPFTGQVVLQ